MKKNQLRRHNIDIVFLMVLFLIFTFSGVSVLLMAVNSYKSVVYANEENGNLRVATSYIREQARAHDEAGAITIDTIDGKACLKLAEADGVSLYIYEYDGYLMELTAKEGSEATADFGNKILKINNMKLSSDDDKIEINIEDTSGNAIPVTIGLKSVEVPDEKQE
ncbi:protein of unknown function [Pseudobutyrivibrio sp. OR37]|uniref:DUF4860 domain-containing protein n=1 Tax=Pseudobutyrivibrio sp. OR37 TaxID=1798186 RepID=UPI0008DECEFC|nr:DUF4860 domain-containing protein [Pseudobutyrivibrio sp. OR37]SFH93053.1 protein of unknown function [Pseudobutyrivibrio sp. OR37]